MTLTLCKPNFEPTEHTDNWQLEGGKASEPRTLVPEAKYEAQATGYKILKFYGVEKIYLRFRIISNGKYEGSTIWAILAKYDIYRPRSSFYKAWVIAMDRKPRKKERLRPDDLCGKIYTIRAVTVKKDEDGDESPVAAQYSKAKIIALSQTTHNLKPNTNYRIPTSPSERRRKKKKK